MRLSAIMFAGLLALGSTAPAAAVTYTTTFSGTLVFAYDPSAMFATSLNGQTFKLKYDVDTSSISNFIDGGILTGHPQVVIAQFSINDVDQGFNSTADLSQIWADANSLRFVVYKTARFEADISTNLYVSVTATFPSGGNGSVSNTFAGLAPTGFDGYFIYSQWNTFNDQSIETGGRFDVTSYNGSAFPATVEPPVAGVPEPASWALMIGGFGLVGVAARRRRSAIAA